MRKEILKGTVAALFFILVSGALNAQGLLDNDTLYIGSVSGGPGEQVVVPLYISTSLDYQGWQIPVKFGDGNSPIYCDSVSVAGTFMENWWFLSPFVNNAEWDNVQTCGIAGVYQMTGGSFPAGYYLVMNLFFTIDSNAPAQTVVLDTTSASWYAGGPMNSYMVTVGGSSYITHVVQGSVNIMPVGVKENTGNIKVGRFNVYPTVVARGSDILMTLEGQTFGTAVLSIFDVSGREVAHINGPHSNRLSYNTGELQRGVYYFVLETAGRIQSRKIVVQ